MIWIPIVLIISVLIFLLLNYRYKNSYYYKNLIKFENRRENNEKWPEGIKMVNLGSVHSRFSFEYSNGNGVNLARAPQSLNYDLKMLELYKNKIPPKTVVFVYLPICIFALKNYNGLRQNSKYYYEFPKYLIDHYSLINKIICLYFPILFAGKQAVYSVYNKKVNSEIEYKNCVIQKDQYDIMARNHLDVWKKQFKIDNMIDGNIDHLKGTFEYNREKLIKIIETCAENDWKPVFVTGPLSEEMNKQISADFIERFYYSNFRDIADKYGVLYLDYRTDKDFSDHDLFWNGVDWLSQNGRKVFMDRVIKDIGL